MKLTAADETKCPFVATAGNRVREEVRYHLRLLRHIHPIIIAKLFQKRNSDRLKHSHAETQRSRSFETNYVCASA